MAHVFGIAATDLLILAISLFSLLLTLLAIGAWRRTRKQRLLPVAAAFALMAGKGLLAYFALTRGGLELHDLELLHSLLDLAIVLLFLAPFVVKE